MTKLAKLPTPELLKPKRYLNPELVKEGMIGIDYHDQKYHVMQCVPVKEYEKVKHESTSGWLDNDSVSELDEDDWLVSVCGFGLSYFGDKWGTEVYVYGPDGFCVYELWPEQLKPVK